MNELIFFSLPMLAGMALGVMFYGGLWWTVLKKARTARPGIWFLLSFLVRFSIALTGIYFITDGQWQRLATCMSGFVLARLLVMWYLRFLFPKQPNPSNLAEESHLAS